jgi:hypothetical protein
MSLWFGNGLRRGAHPLRSSRGSVNANVFIEFLKRLIKGAEREIFLIVDRGSSQRFRANAGWEIALVLFASQFAGPLPIGVGVGASVSGQASWRSPVRKIS